jgi:integrase
MQYPLDFHSLTSLDSTGACNRLSPRESASLHHFALVLFAPQLTFVRILAHYFSSVRKTEHPAPKPVPKSEHVPKTEQALPSGEDALRTISLTQLAFQQAALAWLETRKPYLRSRTYAAYIHSIKTLSVFFGEMKLTEIDGDVIRAYQRMRMLKAGASQINHECSLIQQMLKRIGTWGEMAHDYQPLSLPKESPHRALTELEEERLYRIGPRFPEWDVAYCAFVISINTSAGPGEIRHVRLMDVNWDERIINIQPEGAKNDGRIRRIPLNDPALEAVQYLSKRAEKLGCHESTDYLLPFRVRTGNYDPTRPCKGWRTAHDALMKVCDIRVSPYSFRHHAITKLLENSDVSEETVEAIAGHVSAKMKKHYSHIRIEVRREAVEALGKIARKAISTDRSYPQKKRA